MKNARLLSPHGVSDRNAPESAAILIAEAIVKGDIRPALRNERRSRRVFSIAFSPKGAHARTQQHLCHGSVTGWVRGGSLWRADPQFLDSATVSTRRFARRRPVSSARKSLTTAL